MKIRKPVIFMKLKPYKGGTLKKSGGHSANMCATAMNKLYTFLDFCVLSFVLFVQFTKKKYSYSFQVNLFFLVNRFTCNKIQGKNLYLILYFDPQITIYTIIFRK